MAQKLAIFDFDHTLITGDSFWPFLIYTTSRIETYMALGEAIGRLGVQRLQAGEPIETRTFVKNHLLHRLLAGKPREQMVAAAFRTRLWQQENPSAMRSLREHHEKGDKILIASGGLDLYLPELLRDIPHDALICTDIGVVNGVVTGDMVKGNCVRLRKAERVKEWMEAHGPFDETWAYGNYPHDLPMMDLAKHRIIV